MTCTALSSEGRTSGTHTLGDPVRQPRFTQPTAPTPLRGVCLPTVHYLLHFFYSWRGLLAWTCLGFVAFVAFVAVALAIRAEAKNLRGWTRERKTATGPSGNVGL